MGRRVYLGLFVFVALLASSCDTDQPLQVGEQDGVLQIVANGAQVREFFTWLIFEDSDGDDLPDDINGDGQIDAADRTLWCGLIKNTNGTVDPGDPQSVPWTYSLKVSVIRAGETTAQLLTSAEALGDGFNTAPYDDLELTHFEPTPQNFPVTHARGVCTGNIDIVCNPLSTSELCDKHNAGVCFPIFVCDASPPGVERFCDPANPGGTCEALGAGHCIEDNASFHCSADPSILCAPTCGELFEGSCVLDSVTRKFDFDPTTRRRLTAANRELLEADGNILLDICDGDPACLMQVEVGVGVTTTDPVLGNCPGTVLGEPGLDPGNPNSDATSLAFTLDPGDTLLVEARRSDSTPGGGQVIEFITPPSLSARMFIDGAQLSANEVNGSLSSSDPASPNFSFSFTAQ